MVTVRKRFIQPLFNSIPRIQARNSHTMFRMESGGVSITEIPAGNDVLPQTEPSIQITVPITENFEMTSDKSVSNLSISTESFEDLGPAANSDAANQNQSVETSSIATTVLEPIETNISQPAYENPYLQGSDLVLRRNTDENSLITPPMENHESAVAEYLITGKNKALKLAKIYTDIDTLRPYFDVEPRTIANRIVQSFIPVTDLSSPEKVPSELYGPLMTVLTLVAVLQMNMKTSKTSLEEATLIETALTTCFGYWAVFSLVIYAAVYICSSYINTIQIVSLAGYGICSHVLVSFLSEFFHYGRGPFMLFWFTFCGASALRIGSVLASRTVGNSQRIVILVLMCLVHMGFLLYLHFSYHHIIDEIESFVENIEKKLE